MAVALPSARIEFDGDEKEEREGKQRRPAIAEERQGNAYHGHEADGHAYINEYVEKEDGGHSVAIDPAERLLLSLSHTDETQDEPAEEPQYDGRADEAPLLAHGAEDEVGALFRNEVVFGLRSLQVSFPEETSGAYRYFGLIDIVSPLLRVAFHAEQV